MPDIDTPPAETRTAETTPTIRAIESRVDSIDPKERSIVHVINTDAIDRYDTMIDPLGADFSNYNKNKIVLWCHDDQSPPIGRSEWVKKEKAKKRILAKTIFDPDDFSELVFEKYRSGSLSAWSIRFSPDFKYAFPPTPEEVKERPELKDCWLIYRKWELLEYSAVTVPGNAECLVEGRKLTWKPDIKDAIEKRLLLIPERTIPVLLPEPEPKPELPRLTGARTFSQVHAELVTPIRAAVGRDLVKEAIQRSLDKARGAI